jgi:xylan 1,4-beta-xylosidase
MTRVRIAAGIALMMWACIAAAVDTADAPRAYFDWFEYRGKDAFFDAPLAQGFYRNPILAGFYPDPSVVRVGSRFYLVNSTFSYFPGIPVFESTDLVHWRQVGNVLARTSKLSFTGLGVSRGVFAPSIRYNAGLFYVICTAVDSGGNFISVARDPSGPWSEPAWLPQIAGIDPSFFFDTDGRAYIVNNGEPEGPAQYAGHRAIWMQEFDIERRTPVGPRRVILNGGVNFSEKPTWIEGPHIYRHGDFYYLLCAEGGTSLQHSEVVLRSRSVWGPFVPYSENPILTQRDLAPRKEAIEAAGHADLVDTTDGNWWGVFLGVRPYDKTRYNTGRETFLLPVTWHQGWPILLAHGQPIPPQAKVPTRAAATQATANTGNFLWRDDFNSLAPRMEWLQLRSPDSSWFDFATRPGWLSLTARADDLHSLGAPAFLARRQQHTHFEAATAVEVPNRPDVAAGLAVFQNESSWYFLAVQRSGGRAQVYLERADADGTRRVASVECALGPLVTLRVEGDAGRYSFYYAIGGKKHALLEHDDASFLSTDIAGGFVGTTIGPYAHIVSH